MPPFTPPALLLKVGDRVVGECILSRDDAKRKEVGVINHNGAYGHFVVMPWLNLHKIPNALDSATACLAEPLAVAIRALRRIKDRLNKIGVTTFFDLRNISYDRLIAEFGKAEAQFLRNISEGKDDSEIISYTLAPDVKSIGRNYCLSQNEYNKRKILQNVYELWEEVCIKLRRLNKKARTLGFLLRGNINIHKRKTYSFYFDDSKGVFYLFKSLLYDEKEMFFAKGSYIRQISVWVSNLEKKENLPLSLFDDNFKRKRLLETIDNINNRFGDHTIRNGFLLYTDKLTTVPNGYLADRYERTKLASTADL